jgi:hypothetical protein
MTRGYERTGIIGVDVRARPQVGQLFVADDDLCVSSVKEFPCLSNLNDLTFEVRRKSLVIGNADECFNADFFEHELTLGEELAGKALEQIGLNLLASESETSELVSGQV